MKTPADLAVPDPRTLAFMPLGLGAGISLTPEASVAYWEEVVGRLIIADDVADGTRSSFEDLKTAFLYGVFCYELFTLVHDRALFVFEQALRDRFVEWHGGTVEFVVAGEVVAVRVVSYRDVVDFIQGARGRCTPVPKLLVRAATGNTRLRFNGTLGGLMAWAREVRLLAGQRTRFVEDILAQMRNDIAHPSGYHLYMPVDVTRTLSDLAEIINHLWGHRTPGGRLYPEPICRETVVIAWNRESSVSWSLAGTLGELGWNEYTHFALVQAACSDARVDPDLPRYDSIYEAVNYPTDYLWGPGPRAGALEWLLAHPPISDAANTFDRIFAIRVHDGRLYLPMRPEVAGAQRGPGRLGHWHLVAADTPTNAFSHVRSLYTPDAACTRHAVCSNCYAEHRAEGDLARILAAVPALTEAQLPPDFFVPGVGGGVRSIELTIA